MSANVKVSYAELNAEAKNFRTQEAQINDLLVQLRNKVNALVQNGFVTDSASEQFLQSYDDLKSGLSEAIHGLDGLAVYLEKAAESFQNMDQDLARNLPHGR